MLLKRQVLCKIIIFYEKLFMECGQYLTSQQQLVYKLQVVATYNATLAATSQMPTTSLNGPIGHWKQWPNRIFIVYAEQLSLIA